MNLSWKVGFCADKRHVFYVYEQLRTESEGVRDIGAAVAIVDNGVPSSYQITEDISALFTISEEGKQE